MKPGTKTLADLPLFAPLTPAHLAALDEVADLTGTGPDEVLFYPGDRLQQVHILVRGFVTETRDHREDEAFTDVVVPVTPLGLAPALLDVASPTGARTITSVRLIVIPADPLRALLRADPELARPLLDHALAALNRQAVTICDLKLKSSVQRLAEYLLGLVADPAMNPARFVLPYEKRFLAARIGCSQENLSRAFAALRRFGVETRKGIVVLRDVAGLRAFAGLPVDAA
jgi:CRP/FNR family transcriptional activator FtrB